MDSSQVRASAEPHLNAWLGNLLGNPEQVRCWVEYLDTETDAVLQIREIRLSELMLSPLDVLQITNLDEAEGSELERRLAYRAATSRPAGVPEETGLRLVFARDPAWEVDILDFPAFAEVVRTLRELVTRARAMTPADLGLPGEPPGQAFDSTELQERADRAASAYTSLHGDLQGLLAAPGGAGPEELRERLIRAAYFGLQGAFPLSLHGADDAALETLLSQAGSVEREMGAQVERLMTLEGVFDRAASSPVEQRDHDLARLAIVFGQGLPILPRFTPADPGELAQAFAASSDLLGGDPQQVVHWLQRMTRVRPGAAALGDALLYADALGAEDPLNLRVGQLPFQAGDRWIGLPVDENHPPEANRLSLVAQLPQGFDPLDPLAGLLVDEWVETLPASRETTGVTFHFDQPDARAPNAILLAIPPDPGQPWDLGTLEKILLETFELAKLRAVDTETLADLGQFLPALFFASNERGETVSTDFTRNRASGPEEEIA